MKRILMLGLAVTMVACSARREYPTILQDGDRVPDTADHVVARAHAEGARERARLADEAALTRAEAISTCSGEICAAVTAGRLALGMNEAQVLAATGTAAGAWDIRGTGGDRVMAPRHDLGAPADQVSEVAMVTLRGGAVAAYTYRESQGFRTVSNPADETAVGRSAAQAEALLAEGDRATATGNIERALDFYDRADILRPNHPETTFRIAQILEKAERPLEALMRYQLFLHQMQIERIGARGDAAAKMAEAIALAQQRIIVLERVRQP